MVVEVKLSVNTYCKEDLKRTVSHFYVLIFKQTPRDSDITMILWCPVWGWGYWGHGAARPILHPPRTMHGDIKGQNEICFLQKNKWRINALGWYSGIKCLSKRFHKMHKEAKSSDKTALSHESWWSLPAASTSTCILAGRTALEQKNNPASQDLFLDIMVS